MTTTQESISPRLFAHPAQLALPRPREYGSNNRCQRFVARGPSPAAETATVPGGRSDVRSHSPPSAGGRALRPEGGPFAPLVFYVLMMLLAFGVLPASTSAESSLPDDAAIVAAFAKSHDGYSSDELMIRDDLRDRFLRALQPERQPIDAAAERDAVLRLLKLRKAGKLTPKATRRGRSVDVSWRPIAEIAARAVMDRHDVTTDQMLADPLLLKELHDEAAGLTEEVDDYAVRKSILALRKVRRLRPELVMRVAQWDRQIRTVPLTELSEARIPEQPGVYLFRSDAGYLYIGEASNLAKRMSDHLSGSHNAALAKRIVSGDADRVTVELHVFGKSSPARKSSVRQAYESELIRSRHPKYNLRP